jgi:putative Ca2+/H+ antiporter (TMEM165/GDT1 family)
MPEPEPFLSLGLNAKPPSNPAEQLPAPETLQFHRAEHAPEPGTDPTQQRCLTCRNPITTEYFHVHGKVVCPACAKAIEAGQKAPPAHSLFKAFLFGLGAALAGCALYAIVAIVTGLEFSLIAIVIGYMVGKAIRHASGGLGGRPQQILAVLLTYFAITTSYIPVGIYTYAKQHRQQAQHTQQASPTLTDEDADDSSTNQPRVSLGSVLTRLLVLAFAAPFMSLSHAGDFLSLVIIAVGLQYAWRITGRNEIVVMGPYQAGT